MTRRSIVLPLAALAAGAGVDRSTIIGGTSAYAGAHGTIIATNNGAVITLDG